MLLTKERLQAYRSRAFRTESGLRLTSPDEAVSYINERGYIAFWPIKGIEFPSLWAAVAGDRPVGDHDDPGHISWSWKDDLLGKKRCYYGRVLRKKNTFISLDILPYFYALSPNYGDPQEDYLIDYEQGRLTAASKNIYEVLLRQGPSDTITIRKSAGLTSQASNTEFNRAMEELQTSFRILPVGVSQAGAWNYAFIYDILPHHFTDMIEQAHSITEPQAHQKILALFLQSVGAACFSDIRRLFANQPHNWSPHIIERDLQKMEERGEIVRGVECEGLKEPGILPANLV